MGLKLDKHAWREDAPHAASHPLVQSLAHPSMRPRHWQSLIELTGEHLPVGTDDFKMRNVLEAGLLEHREEVEDIANSAVKELQIEEKLAAISDDWSDEQLSFANFKARGQITLQPGQTGELMEKVEFGRITFFDLKSSQKLLYR